MDYFNELFKWTARLRIAGKFHRLFLIYPQGNLIEATPEMPYLQISESTFG